MKKKNKPVLLAVSGVKNSGKTTLIEGILPKLKEAGYKAATVKHDGHDFECDIEGTDTYKHKKAGAFGTAIFSKNRFMVVKEQQNTSEEEIISYFNEADIIILEGFKYSDYPKIEIVRKGNSNESVCRKETLLAIATDIEDFGSSVNTVDLNDINSIVSLIIEFIKRRKNEGHF